MYLIFHSQGKLSRTTKKKIHDISLSNNSHIGSEKSFLSVMRVS